MTASEIQAWRENYRATSEALLEIRYREVNALTDDDVREQILRFDGIGEVWRFQPEWSGLVEQQAIFHGLPRD